MRTLPPLALAALLTACTSTPPDPRTDDLPTRGAVTLLADADFRAVIEGEVLAFANNYPQAEVEVRYTAGVDVLRDLMNDTLRVAFTTVMPGAEQQAYFNSRNLYPEVVPVLTDGIAVVRAPGQPDTIGVGTVMARLRGDTEGRVLFDGPGSAVVLALADSLFDGDAAGMFNAAAAENVDSLVRRLAADPSLLGLISFAHISDLDDPRCRALREQLTLCRVAPRAGGEAVALNQSTLADGSYPLRRTLYAVVTEGKTGLGTGFVSFVAGYKGQRAILKSGLAPIRVPARDVEIVQ
ncbi:MAG: substrate-binding domain-containing protein [Flavobacteriales bacterium]|jgi:phosphate transport system substrate-binding protein|nr:substrate-binding domain-containing protein [Flavobacteriales bacterium]